jgi:hypothetical protein
LITTLSTEAADIVAVIYQTLFINLLMTCLFFIVVFVAETKGRQVLSKLVSVFTKFNRNQLKRKLCLI